MDTIESLRTGEDLTSGADAVAGADVLALVLDGGDGADVGASLRADIKSILNEDGYTQARVARESGLNDGVLSQWLRGKYPGDVQAVEAKLTQWLRARGDRRRAAAVFPTAPGYFEGPTAKTVWAALTYAQTAGAMTQVVTSPGLGKTTTATEYQKRQPNVWLVTMSPTCRGLVSALEEICDALGMRPESGARRLERSIMRRVRDTRGLLVIDEAQHLSIQAHDSIRSIHDATQIGITLLGNEQLAARTSGAGAGRRAEETAQLSSRIGYRRLIRRVHKEDVAAQLEAWRVTGRAEQEFLTDVGMRPGGLRSVNQVLKLATVLSTSRAEPLARKHLDAAWRQLSTTE